nr:SRA stem-loop-interacting RNA-binding protein; mitochondrial [Biomphalaria glabrata]
MSRFALVVRNIGWACIKSDITSYFKKFGDVHNVRIPMNYTTGFNRNVAFFTLHCDQQSLESVLKDYHVISGNEVTVEIKTGVKKDSVDQ